METAIKLYLVASGALVAIHTFMMANYTTAAPWYFKPLLLVCVFLGTLTAAGGFLNVGMGIYACVATLGPLIAVQLIAWAHGAEVSEQVKKKELERERRRIQDFNRLKREILEPMHDYRDILTEEGQREVERIK
jgi:ribose/xylose/arabinose/galactoside ABC-type transport system permease subunit